MPAIHCAHTSALSPGHRRDSSSAPDGRSVGGLEAADAASAGAGLTGSRATGRPLGLWPETRHVAGPGAARLPPNTAAGAAGGRA